MYSALQHLNLGTNWRKMKLTKSDGVSVEIVCFNSRKIGFTNLLQSASASVQRL